MHSPATSRSQLAPYTWSFLNSETMCCSSALSKSSPPRKVSPLVALTCHPSSHHVCFAVPNTCDNLCDERHATAT